MGPINESDYLGLPADEAVKRAEREGWVVRVLHADTARTDDQRFDRLNLMVDASSSVIEAKVF